MAKKKYYAVKRGYKSNVIVKTWAECELLVTGFAGAIYKGFTCEADAKKFIRGKNPSWIKKPIKRDKYGYKKERYYMVNGIRHADYGRTVGINYVEFTGDQSVAPW